MRAAEQTIADLEIALLRRGVTRRIADQTKCRRCDRTPLIGERVYVYAHGETLCELCRSGRQDDPVDSAVVHGPALGRSIRITDRRAA